MMQTPAPKAELPNPAATGNNVAQNQADGEHWDSARAGSPPAPDSELLAAFNRALLEAFDHAALSRMVRFQLGDTLEWFTPVHGQRDLTTVVDHLVAYYASQPGGLNRLLMAAAEANPGSQPLSQLAQTWSNRTFTPIPLPSSHPSVHIGAVIQGPITLARTYVQNPGTLYSDLSRFAQNRPLITSVFVLLQVALANIFWIVKDTYRLSLILYISLALLLALALLALAQSQHLRRVVAHSRHPGHSPNSSLHSWQNDSDHVIVAGSAHQDQSRPSAPLVQPLSQSQPSLKRAAALWQTIAIAAAAGWAIILAARVIAITNPIPFEQESFGIAIATIGQPSNANWGPFVRAASDGNEIADRVQRQIDNALQQEGFRQGTGHQAEVQTQRIGTLPTGDVPIFGSGLPSSNSRAEGVHTALNADLVIWGELVRDGQMLDINLALNQGAVGIGPNGVGNPTFPQPVPLRGPVQSTYLTIPYANSDAFRTIIQEQALGLAQFSLGLAFYADHQIDTAIPHFEAALAEASEPTSTKLADDSNIQLNQALIHFYLGRSYQLLGEVERSIQKLDQALATESNLGQRLAIQQVQLSNLRAASAKEHATLQLTALESEEEASGATIAVEKGPFTQQLEKTYAEILRNSQSNDPAVRYNRARSHEIMQHDEAALADYLATLIYDPTYLVAHLGAAGIFIDQQQFDHAREHLQQATVLANGTANTTSRLWVQFSLASLLDAEAQAAPNSASYEAVVNAYQKAAALDPNNTLRELTFRLARAQGRAGAHAAAQATYARLIQQPPFIHRAHVAYGDYLLSLAIEPDNDNRPKENRDLLKQDLLKQAITQFELALQSSAYDVSRVHAKVGNAYTQLGDEANAVAAFEAALAEPGAGLATTLHDYGIMRHHFGQLDEAIHYMHQSQAVNPTFAGETIWNLASFYEQRATSAQAANSTADLAQSVVHYEMLLKQCEKLSSSLLQALLERATARGLQLNLCTQLPKG